MTPWTAAYKAPLSKGFSRQQYWNGLPLPSLKQAICITISINEVKDQIISLSFFSIDKSHFYVMLSAVLVLKINIFLKTHTTMCGSSLLINNLKESSNFPYMITVFFFFKDD